MHVVAETFGDPATLVNGHTGRLAADGPPTLGLTRILTMRKETRNDRREQREREPGPAAGHWRDGYGAAFFLGDQEPDLDLEVDASSATTWGPYAADPP